MDTIIPSFSQNTTPPEKTEKNTYLQKRSLLLSGHATSVALEPEFWNILEKAAQQAGLPLSKFISQIDSTQRDGRPLASALRLRALKEAFSFSP